MRHLQRFLFLNFLLIFAAVHAADQQVSKVIAYSNPDGSVAVIVMTPAYVKEKKAAGMSEEQILEAERARRVPKDAVSVAIVDRSSVPPERRWRTAWKLNGGKLEVDLEKAKACRAKEICAEAEKQLKATDAEFMKALEMEQGLAEVKARRAELRAAMQVDLSQCKTVKELEQFKPAALEKK